MRACFALILVIRANSFPSNVGAGLTSRGQSPRPYFHQGQPRSKAARWATSIPLLSARIRVTSRTNPENHVQGGPKAKYRMVRALTIVGRDAMCGLTLSGTRVSSAHCILYSQQGRLWCVDLLSANGTFLNNQRSDIVEIQASDRLRVGEFHVHYMGNSRENPKGGPSARSTLGRFTLQFH